MIVEDSPDVYGYTIFCDDIRVEVGGKLTYVGAYSGKMVVQGTFPVMLPRFAMHIMYMQRQPNVVPPTKFFVIFPGASEENPTITFEIPEDASIGALKNAEGLAEALPTEKNVYATIGGPLNLANVVITQPGTIKVRAVRGDKLIRLGALQVVLDPNFVPPPNPAPPPAN